MGAAYAEALRERVVGALDAGMSKWQAHKTFKVARTTIDSWLKRRVETGSVAAKTSYYRGRPPAIEDTPEVHAFVEEHKEKTQQQLAQAWFERHGQRLTAKTFCKTLKRLGYTRKKRASAIGRAVWMREKPFQQS